MGVNKGRAWKFGHDLCIDGDVLDFRLVILPSCPRIREAINAGDELEVDFLPRARSRT